MYKNQIVDRLNRLIHDDSELAILIDAVIRNRYPDKFPSLPINTEPGADWDDDSELAYYDAHAMILMSCLGQVIENAAPVKSK